MGVGGVKAEFQTFLPQALEGCKCLASRYTTLPLGKEKRLRYPLNTKLDGSRVHLEKPVDPYFCRVSKCSPPVTCLITIMYFNNLRLHTRK
jgi:hypothetical protein